MIPAVITCALGVSLCLILQERFREYTNYNRRKEVMS